MSLNFAHSLVEREHLDGARRRGSLKQDLTERLGSRV